MVDSCRWIASQPLVIPAVQHPKVLKIRFGAQGAEFKHWITGNLREPKKVNSSRGGTHLRGDVTGEPRGAQRLEKSVLNKHWCWMVDGHYEASALMAWKIALAYWWSWWWYCEPKHGNLWLNEIINDLLSMMRRSFKPWVDNKKTFIVKHQNNKTGQRCCFIVNPRFIVFSGLPMDVVSCCFMFVSQWTNDQPFLAGTACEVVLWKVAKAARSSARHSNAFTLRCGGSSCTWSRWFCVV